MRTVVVLVALTLSGCSQPAEVATPATTPESAAAPVPTQAPALSGAAANPVVYTPETFRAEVERFIGAKRYADAVALVRAADIDRQVAFDRRGYVAVAMDMILLPGVEPGIAYDPDRDWEMPGTSDAIENAEWQEAATDYAERYNRHRRAAGSGNG